MAEYIDRYALTKNMCKAICGRDAGLCVAEPKDCSWKEMRAVFETPVADVAPVVHGRWTPKDYIIPTAGCSVCGSEVQTDDYGEASSYCPWCGAKMDKEDADA